jgi:membrane-associated phospholipid phosphatase
MFPGYGFMDRLTGHESGIVQLAANPYAAMPSLHAADALIVGVIMTLACRHWLVKALWSIWPVWVWFTVMATANHYWLDVAVGALVALVGLSLAWGRDYRVRVAEATA